MYCARDDDDVLLIAQTINFLESRSVSIARSHTRSYTFMLERDAYGDSSLGSVVYSVRDSLSVFGKRLEKLEKSGVLLGKNVIRVLVDYLNFFICVFTCFVC